MTGVPALIAVLKRPPVWISGVAAAAILIVGGGLYFAFRPNPAPAPQADSSAPPRTVATEPVIAGQPSQSQDASGDADIAYGAYQRGYYLTAFQEATKRIDAKNDPKSMTLLGELYAEGLGVANDDKKALEWYRLAASRGDREAMFSLAMFRLTGRGGPTDRTEGAKLLADAAKRGHIVAAYDLALLYLEGQTLPQDFARAAELMKMAAEAGNPQAQYALATLYREGHGVQRDLQESARWLGLAARSGYLDAEVEYGIVLFNGTGIAKDERTAGEYLMKAARKNSAPAQSRLAMMYATGRGIEANPVEAARWHLIARAGGDNDQFMDDFVRKMKPADRTAAEDKAKPWIARMQAANSSPFPDPPAPQPMQQAKP